MSRQGHAPDAGFCCRVAGQCLTTVTIDGPELLSTPDICISTHDNRARSHAMPHQVSALPPSQTVPHIIFFGLRKKNFGELHSELLAFSRSLHLDQHHGGQIVRLLKTLPLPDSRPNREPFYSRTTHITTVFFFSIHLSPSRKSSASRKQIPD